MKKMGVGMGVAVVALAWFGAGLGILGGPKQPKAAHAGRLAGMAGAAVSGIQVQNVDAVLSATITADFFHQSGGPPVSIVRPNVPAGAAANIYVLAEPGLRNGAYAAAITADRAIASIARTDWNASGGAAIYSHAQPATDIVIPLVMRQAGGQTSHVTIQNTDQVQAASAKVAFTRSGETTPLTTATVSIGPGTSTTLNLDTHRDFATVPAGTIGAMRITSQTPLAAQTFVDVANSGKAVYAFEGVPTTAAAHRLYVPLFRNQFYGTTGIAVMNPGTSVVDVTVTYSASGLAGNPACSDGQTFVHNGGPVPLGAGTSLVFYQANLNLPGSGRSGLPSGCFGAAVIEATGPVVAVVNDADLGKGTAGAYNAVSDAGGAKRVALPLYRNKHTADDLSTGIQVMNLGSAPANLSLIIRDNSGQDITGACGGECTRTIAPRASYTWYPPSMPAQSAHAGEYGSALVIGSQPLAVIVNDASGKGTKDAAIYNGVPADAGIPSNHLPLVFHNR